MGVGDRGEGVALADLGADRARGDGGEEIGGAGLQLGRGGDVVEERRAAGEERTLGELGEREALDRARRLAETDEGAESMPPHLGEAHRRE